MTKQDFIFFKVVEFRLAHFQTYYFFVWGCTSSFHLPSFSSFSLFLHFHFLIFYSSNVMYNEQSFQLRTSTKIVLDNPTIDRTSNSSVPSSSCRKNSLLPLTEWMMYGPFHRFSNLSCLPLPSLLKSHFNTLALSKTFLR